MTVRISKRKRELTLWDGDRLLLRAPVALSPHPDGPKQREGDERTPEGEYRVCLIKECGKYGRSLGLSYPGPDDATAALRDGRIDEPTCKAILQAHREGRRPPWGTPLGGEIYLHEGGAQSDWTKGCIALETDDMELLFAHRAKIESVVILP